MREKDGKKDAYTLSLVLILLVLGIIMAGYLHYSHYARNYQEQAEAQLAAVAELKVAELVQYRSERLGDAMILYQNPTFVSLVRHFFQSQDDPKARTLLHGWMNHLQHVYRYDRIMLFDADGVERLSLPDTKAIISPQISRAGSEVIQSGRIVLEDFYRNEYTQRIHLSLLIPVLDQAGRPPLGLLVMRIDPEKQLYPIINRWPTLSRTAETLLIRREGDAAVLLNNLRVEPRKALSWRISLDHKDVVAVRAVLGEEGIVEGRGFQGRPVIAALRTVPDSPWALVARIDKAEVYAPLRERMWETAGIVMALLISAAAGIGFLWRQRSIDFYRHRYESAELLRENESRLRRAEPETGAWTSGPEQSPGRTACIGSSVSIRIRSNLLRKMFCSSSILMIVPSTNTF
ncbi:MAG TPA: cache domain-containing protein [Thermodesulfobacteriota bacterium]|nr:cache domain-containing protein [Thermodesulfobacteriota bacterium]